MSWLRLDDHYDENPKVDAVSDAAFRLHITASLYCARNLTDGFVPTTRMRMLAGRFENPPAVIAELTAAPSGHDHGLFEPVEGGYVVHDRGESSPSRQLHPVRLAWNRIRSAIAPLLMEEYAHRCLNCHSGEDLTIDHIIPIDRGGGNDRPNLQVLCRSCNSRKGVAVHGLD